MNQRRPLARLSVGVRQWTDIIALYRIPYIMQRGLRGVLGITDAVGRPEGFNPSGATKVARGGHAKLGISLNSTTVQ